VTLHGGNREIGYPGIGYFLFVGDLMRQFSQAGAQDNCSIRDLSDPVL
jgi:hypothetical protein